MHYEELSLRHQTFLSEYVQNGFNAAQAYRDVYKNCDPDVARRCGSRLLSKDDIQKALEELVNKISPEYVLSLINSIALDSKRDSDRLRAAELLGKYHALFKDTSQNLNLNVIGDKDIAQIREKMKVPELPQVVVPIEDKKEEVIASETSSPEQESDKK